MCVIFLLCKMWRNLSIIVIIFFITVRLTCSLNSLDTQFYKHLDCVTVSKHVVPTKSLNNCTFSENNLLSNIECSIFSLAKGKENTIATIAGLRYDMKFILHEKSNISVNGEPADSWWCVQLKSSFAKIVDIPESNLPNQWTFSHEVSALLDILNKPYVYIKFNGNATAAFIKLKKECETGKLSLLDHSCIQRFELARYINIGIDANDTIDDILKRLKYVFFYALDGSVFSASASTSKRGLVASQWLTYANDTRIRKFDLSNNNFNSPSVFPHRFSGFTSLQYLYMNRCAMKEILADNFKNGSASNLIELDLSNNNFERIPNGIYLLKLLKILDISYQQINQHIIFNLGNQLRNLTQLEYLNLSGLNLYNITSRSSLPNSSSLENLDLSHCNLYNLGEDTFQDLISLKYLNLTDNKIAKLPSNIFQNLAPQADIYLKSNQLTRFEGLILNTVQVFDISYNGVEHMADIVLIGVVDYLDLSGNQIRIWEEYFDTRHFDLKHLNLSYNMIPTISKNMAIFLNTLSSVDLGNNKFYCNDCNIPEFHEFLQATNTLILADNKSTQQLKCSYPNGTIQNILATEYNKVMCEGVIINIPLISGLICFLIFILVNIGCILSYYYRYEITYLKHLLNVKRKKRNNEEKEGCMYDVFVSYCSKDRNWIWNVLLPGLENPEDKYILCLHERDFRLGSLIVDNIVNCIDKSRRVICVISENYITSEWCQWELQMAQHRIFEDCKDFLVLIQLERINREQVPLHLRILMTSRTYLEWPAHVTTTALDYQSTFWLRLKQALGVPIATTQLSDDEDYEENVV